MVTLYDSSDALSARYVHGSNAAADDPLVWYSGTGLIPRLYLHADRLGSIIAVTDYQGIGQSRNAYDEYGVPAPNNTGRFQYTGQMWLPQLGMYYYKSRLYSAQLGRFMQTDPIGYDGGMNFYAYVGGDPVNGTDFSGEVLDTIADLIFIGADVADIHSNGLNWTNGVSLGANILGAALPGATGLGVGTRALMKGGEAGNAARAAATARGRSNEARKLAEIGATRNTSKVSTSTGNRVRDGTMPNGNHVEVKDVKRLYATKQLRGLDEAAEREGKRLQLHTGTNTRVSGNIDRQLRNTDVIRCPSLGPSCK